jgi:hypothetical protein
MDRKRGTEALQSLDIAFCLDIAYMHGTDEGTDEGVDSGAFKERFKASFEVAPVLVVNWLYVVTWRRDYDARDPINSGVWISTLEPSPFFLH